MKCLWFYLIFSYFLILKSSFRKHKVLIYLSLNGQQFKTDVLTQIHVVSVHNIVKECLLKQFCQRERGVGFYQNLWLQNVIVERGCK